MKNTFEFIGETIALCNQSAEGKTPPEWIEVPFGNHDHREGLQVLDRESAEAIVESFREEKASKRFAGLPIYVGHPDHPAFADAYKDKSAKAWIKEIALAPGALRLRTHWNASGRHLVANEEYKYFSPTWGAIPIAGRSAAYRPVRLKSVGLTNEPNIGVMPLTNEKETPMQTLPPWLVKLLGLADDATEEHVKEKLAEVMKRLDESEKANALQLANEQTARAGLEAAFANERKARVELLVGSAISQAHHARGPGEDPHRAGQCGAGELRGARGRTRKQGARPPDRRGAHRTFGPAQGIQRRRDRGSHSGERADGPEPRGLRHRLCAGPQGQAGTLRQHETTRQGLRPPRRTPKKERNAY